MECLWILIVKYQDFVDEYDLGEFIKEEMSKSRVVIVQGYPYPNVQFSPENIWRVLKIPQDYKVEVLGMFLFKLLLIIN